ncbi:O-methyltransferase [Fadolivirus algeromassiliense]|jgi:catechol O-methyltransferase|uniref:O-methyltransferase n=1 Tax=Fadolivirus FV1/VV64 TaxID=3070911 RepID=A0A7D3R122_9VIRU|nr:O-methyltransferase [Fadolivirus algeromassiliense]QKF93498.1 O-methyltransferase [Fadolivirus FV1/VV64]
MSQIRSTENGALQFHKGTEDKLADYVIENAKLHDPDSVISVVDQFCWNNHWMMHVGDKKGEIIDLILKEYKPKIILELGTYCGYSAVRMARFLPDYGQLFTIDPYATECSKRLINHSGLEDKITCMTGFAKDMIPNLVLLKGKVDMVFIDHDKQSYLSDLLLIEQNELLHSGSIVVADNVIVFKINKYLDHVRNSGLYSSSINHLSTLEYDDSGLKERVDGIEVSVWKGN